ncbi:MBL fold metallo-hydrolase [Roseateles aquatilis]|uniref:MBL fold metallo-hydrolase n=1 Tax=Roseateles aquatilis TaxID=431061 RepID=A0A246J2G2_9BURK|nr:MBL fold metallo-hydrolase [Roseateles aquatilis]OWQ86789.1 MBL fold metallo-hydrolase [Roseateles aquatilis]
MSDSLLPAGVTVLERGWLSSNNILLHGTSADEGAVLIDSGYASHAQQTLALIGDALHEGESLRLIANTHLHSDHCGGNAALVARHGCPIVIPPGDFEAVQAWDERRLSYRATGQRCERFSAAGKLLPGDRLRQGRLIWEVHAAPGHDPHSVILFERSLRTLISADALWERGFGIVFPELDGDSAFDEVEDTLNIIEALRPEVVIPGHGAVFIDVPGALSTARQKLAYFRKEPARHALHAVKALIVFHMLEVQESRLQALIDWLTQTPVLLDIWQRFYSAEPLQIWAERVIGDLVRNKALNASSAGADAVISIR